MTAASVNAIVYIDGQELARIITEQQLKSARASSTTFGSYAGTRRNEIRAERGIPLYTSIDGSVRELEFSIREAGDGTTSVYKTTEVNGVETTYAVATCHSQLYAALIRDALNSYTRGMGTA